jgi:DNA adenine methylase
MSKQLSFFNHKIDKVPSLVKWTGSKRKTVEQIIKYFPKKIDKYFEPFLGSGSILYAVKSLYPNSKVYGSDIYKPLIDIFKNISQNPEDIKKNYRNDWLKLQNNFPKYFYTKRKQFNNRNNFQDLIFLSRTCVNGIIRFNKNHEFNNSLHLSRRGMNPDAFDKVVDRWSSNIQNNSFFQCCDYSKILKHLKKNDFVYLDPPYLNSKNRYIENLDINRFFIFLRELDKKKILYALSFDGSRNDIFLDKTFPKELFKRKIKIKKTISTLSNVLNKKKLDFTESLYLNY